jgi:hypothetical protein
MDAPATSPDSSPLGDRDACRSRDLEVLVRLLARQAAAAAVRGQSATEQSDHAVTKMEG